MQIICGSSNFRIHFFTFKLESPLGGHRLGVEGNSDPNKNLWRFSLQSSESLSRLRNKKKSNNLSMSLDSTSKALSACNFSKPRHEPQKNWCRHKGPLGWCYPFGKDQTPVRPFACGHHVAHSRSRPTWSLPNITAKAFRMTRVFPKILVPQNGWWK